MDNETSDELKAALTKKHITFHLAPPHMHRTNAAEKAIQIWNNHFTSILVNFHSKFSIAECDQLMVQTKITLNLLRNSRTNPRLSAYAYIRGQFDFNAKPMALPGTKIIMHDKPKNRASWENHGTDEWYIGPPLDHYRCVKCFFPITKSVKDGDTVIFYPETIPFPETTLSNHLQQAASDIVNILDKQPNITTVPSLEVGDDTRNEILKIEKILNHNEEIPETLPIIAPTLVPNLAQVPTLVQNPTQKIITNPTSRAISAPMIRSTPSQSPPNIVQLLRVQPEGDSGPVPRVPMQAVTTPRKRQSMTELIKHIHKAIKAIQQKYDDRRKQPTR